MWLKKIFTSSSKKYFGGKTHYIFVKKNAKKIFNARNLNQGLEVVLSPGPSRQTLGSYLRWEKYIKIPLNPSFFPF